MSLHTRRCPLLDPGLSGASKTQWRLSGRSVQAQRRVSGGLIGAQWRFRGGTIVPDPIIPVYPDPHHQWWRPPPSLMALGRAACTPLQGAGRGMDAMGGKYAAVVSGGEIAPYSPMNQQGQQASTSLQKVQSPVLESIQEPPRTQGTRNIFSAALVGCLAMWRVKAPPPPTPPHPVQIRQSPVGIFNAGNGSGG